MLHVIPFGIKILINITESTFYKLAFFHSIVHSISFRSYFHLKIMIITFEFGLRVLSYWQ